ncbi:MAG TPA: hypothetical protein VGF56_05675 [Rhizomicrobium sp.]|jgi:hypothetical protein
MEQSYKLAVWKHPKSGETRVYINGGPLESQDKLYIFEGPRAGAWDAKLYCPFGPNHIVFAGISGLGSNLYDIGLNLAEIALAERGLAKCTFQSIVAVLEGTGTAVEVDAVALFAAPNNSAEIKERAEFVQLAKDGAGTFEDGIVRMRRARKIIKADEELLEALAAVRLSGSKKFGSKAQMKDWEVAADFALRVGVEGLTPTEISQMKGQLIGGKS